MAGKHTKRSTTASSGIPKPWAPILLFAYIDAATGGILLQAVLGGIAAAAVALRIFWSRLTQPFRRGDIPSASEMDGPSPEDGPRDA